MPPQPAPRVPERVVGQGGPASRSRQHNLTDAGLYATLGIGERFLTNGPGR
jgi:hypothetical protein